MKEFNRELDDGDNLSRFFSVCERFNERKPLNFQLKMKIEQFFQFKWNNVKNLALVSIEDKAIFNEIPEWL